MGTGIVWMCKLLFPVWYLLSNPVPCLHSPHYTPRPCHHPIMHTQAVIPVSNLSSVHASERGSWKGSMVLGG